LITGYCLALFTDYNGDSKLKNKVGYGMVGALLLCILVNWGAMAYKIGCAVIKVLKTRMNKRVKKGA